MSLILRDLNLGDCLIVSAYLPAEERKQIEVFTGAAYHIDANALAAYRFRGPKWTAVDEAHSANALAVGGFIQKRPGVVETWFMAREEVWTSHGKEISRLLKGLIAQQLQDGIHRVETIVLASREKTRRWYELIGLHFESHLHGFGVGGEDAAIYVALRKPGVTH